MGQHVRYDYYLFVRKEKAKFIWFQVRYCDGKRPRNVVVEDCEQVHALTRFGMCSVFSFRV